MGQTVVGVGSPLAAKLYSRALFNETTRKNGFSAKMIGPSPKQGKAERKSKMQSSADYPFVRVTDLSKTAGDRVSIDLFNDIQGKPIMGDQKLAGKMMSLTSDSMDIYINQCRGGIDTGGRMTQQRTLHNLRSMAKAKMVGWNQRLEDQLCLVHAAGARGFDVGPDWVVPLASDPDFGDITVNSILPPTVNRRFFANYATGADNIDASDELRLDDLDRLRAYLDELAYPMTPIKLEGDVAAEEDPLFCLYVTSRQWHWIQTNTTSTVWRTFLTNAHERGSMLKHPLFLGQRGMWNGILIKKLWRPIRFPTGADVIENDAGDESTTTVQTTVDVDRALLFGAEAVGIVYGKHQGSDFYYNWHEETTDHGNTLEVSTASMSGKSKIRFKGTDGSITDHGVMAVDSYAKDPLT